jgi:hypothetical protein
MFDCDTNLTKAKNLSLAIVSKCDAITYCVILFKICEHLLSVHMIDAPTIKHPTCSTRGVDIQERIKPCF